MRGIGRGLRGFWGSWGSEFFFFFFAFFCWAFVPFFLFVLFWAVSCSCSVLPFTSCLLFFVSLGRKILTCMEWFSTGILIIIFEKDMFDYKSGEPPENYLTVLRALEVRFPSPFAPPSLLPPCISFPSLSSVLPFSTSSLDLSLYADLPLAALPSFLPCHHLLSLLR